MAVYTHVEEEELEAFLKGYDVGEIRSFKGIAEGVQNTNYLLGTNKANFILTLYERGSDLSELPFFLKLMEHLANKGVACPIPIPAKDGNQLNKS